MDKKKQMYSVPEGYFGNLQERLMRIPSQQLAGETVSGPQPAKRLRLRPYLALAASFVAAFIIGNAILKSTAGKPAEDYTYEQYVAMTSPESIYTMAYENSVGYDSQDNITDEDIVNYLIASGCSSERLNWVLAQNQ